jgi:hypothetical protein
MAPPDDGDGARREAEELRRQAAAARRDANQFEGWLGALMLRVADDYEAAALDAAAASGAASDQSCGRAE